MRIRALIITTLFSALLLASEQSEIIPWETLAEYLPQTLKEMPRYGKTEGMTLASDDTNMSTVTVKYGTEGNGGQVTITQYSGVSNQYWQKLLMKSGSENRPGETIHKTEIKGYTAIVSYKKHRKIGRVKIGLKNAIMIAMVIKNINKYDEIIEAFQEIDLNAINELKSKPTS